MDGGRDWTVFDRPELRSGIGTVTPAGCEVLLALDGMHCANCASRAEAVLAGQASDVRLNLAARTVGFCFQPQRTRLSDLLRMLEQSGLEPRVLAGDDTAAHAARARRLDFARIGVATICAMQVMMLAWPSYFGVRADPGIAQLLRWAQFIVATPGVLWAGWPFFAGGWRAARARALDMNVPVALALGVAFAASAVRTAQGSGDLYFDTATMFVWFLTLGRFLEGRTRARAGEHLRLLARRRALTAQRRAGHQLETVAIGQIRAGDVVVVGSGDALPADGRLLENAADLDEALLSGESRPVLRQVDQPVLAGSMNLGEAPLAFRVERIGGETVLAQITGLLDRAQSAKPKLQQLADRMAAHFVAIILLLASLGFILALARGSNADQSFNIALAVLVASCPCALSLAVPAALAAATSKLARAGLLVANADALQALAAVDTVLFDKTGTLTLPALRLLRTHPLADAGSVRCTHIAAALERGSRHPIAAAFGACASPLLAQDVRHQAGVGVSGLVDGRRYWLGAAERAPFPPATPLRAGEDGETSIVLCDEARAIAAFALGAAVRAEAAALMEELARRGLQLELLSGDAEETVRVLAQRLNIARYAARQSPASKLSRLQQLQAQGRRVLAVGDGLNDAPLLAGADVSACMPLGAALTQARADLLLLGDSLAPIALALDVARSAQSRIRENLSWALLYNLLVLPLAMTGHLAPWLAAAGMSCSSLLVVANALRMGAGSRRMPLPHAFIQPATVH